MRNRHARPGVNLLFTVSIGVGIALSGYATTATASPSRTAALLDRASQYERGDRVARDYTRAIRIYEALCAHATGDLVACRKFFDLYYRGRGRTLAASYRMSELMRWRSLACMNGDWLACDLVSFDFEAAHAACDRGELTACFVVSRERVYSPGGKPEFPSQPLRLRACEGGLLEACIDALRWPNGDRELVSLAAVRRVTVGCVRGNADACAAVGTPISPARLCRADDFKACAVPGSDPASLERACKFRIREACDLLAVAARDAAPPDPRLAARLARACEVGGALCDQNRPADLAIGCAAYRPIRIPPPRRVTMPRLSGTNPYDSSWSARQNVPFVLIPRYAGGTANELQELAGRLRDEVEVYVPEWLTTMVSATRIEPALAFSPDHSLASAMIALPPADGWSAGDPLDYTGSAVIVVDAASKPRAVVTLDEGLLPSTFARCVRGLLAEP